MPEPLSGPPTDAADPARSSDRLPGPGTSTTAGERGAEHQTADDDIGQTLDDLDDVPDRSRPAGRSTRATVVLLCVGAAVFLVIGAILGVALAPQRSSSSTESAPGPVDLGFARDMIVHHSQGVQMASIALRDSTDTDVRVIAQDIQYTQTAQIGQMQGWLALWQEPQSDPNTLMAWMTDSAGQPMDMGVVSVTATAAAGTSGAADSAAAAQGAVMPGMATNAEMTRLAGLRGRASDVYFLQLMIRHHQGGAAMMQYAAAHALSPIVRNFAGQMYQAQSAEIGQMTGLLSQFGAAPLAFSPPTVPGASATSTH